VHCRFHLFVFMHSWIPDILIRNMCLNTSLMCRMSLLVATGPRCYIWDGQEQLRVQSVELSSVRVFNHQPRCASARWKGDIIRHIWLTSVAKIGVSTLYWNAAGNFEMLLGIHEMALGENLPWLTSHWTSVIDAGESAESDGRQFLENKQCTD
jgi:hypothetical protein